MKKMIFVLLGLVALGVVTAIFVMISLVSSALTTASQPQIQGVFHPGQNEPHLLVIHESEAAGLLTLSLHGTEFPSVSPSVDALKLALGDAIRADAPYSILIIAEKKVSQANIGKLIDACRQAGIPQVSLYGADPANLPAISPAITWKSFSLGVASTSLALLGVTAFLFLWRRWQSSRHENELRRIASLDS